jgi:uncharacterized OB-fold protein
MKVYSCCNIESLTKKYFCPVCGGNEFTTREVSDAGNVYSYTTIRIAPAEFADIAPYNVVLVQLDEADCKVTTRMLEDVEIGEAVVLDKLDKGAYLYKKALTS